MRSASSRSSFVRRTRTASGSSGDPPRTAVQALTGSSSAASHPSRRTVPAATSRSTAARTTAATSGSTSANPRSSLYTAGRGSDRGTGGDSGNGSAWATSGPPPPSTWRRYGSAAAADRASTPAEASPDRSGEGSSPFVVFSPNTPHQAAGMRTDPAPSLPVASSAIPVATATADPADDPPGVRSARHGLTVRPCVPRPQVCQWVPGPGTEVAPTGEPPAAISRRAAKDRIPEGPFTANGSPPRGSRRTAASRSRVSASSGQTSMNACSAGSSRPIRSRARATAEVVRVMGPVCRCAPPSAPATPPTPLPSRPGRSGPRCRRR